jgi:hypothetical protein
MERVTDERLAELIGAAKRSNYVLYVLCYGTSDALDALVELRDRRAAEREQPALEPDTWPLGWTLVQDGGMVRVVNSKGVVVAAYAIQIESAPVAPRNVQCHDVADFYKDEEPQEQAATEANTKPLGWVDRLLEDWEKGYENAVDGSVSKTTAAWYINRLREAYSEQAAPEPRKPTKWERRLDRMSGGLHFNYSGGEGWYASWMIDGGVVKYAYGDTPKAAVEAAWKAWKEERGE